MHLPQYVFLLIALVLACGFTVADAITERRVMFVGDSITQGVRAGMRRRLRDPYHPPNGTDTFRRPLFHMLQRILQNEPVKLSFVGPEKGSKFGMSPHTDFDVAHAGYWGLPAYAVRHKIPAAIEHFDPHVVSVLIGTNDITFSMLNSSTYRRERLRNPRLLGGAVADRVLEAMRSAPLQTAAAAPPRLRHSEEKYARFAFSSILRLVDDVARELDAVVTNHSAARAEAVGTQAKDPRRVVLCELIPRGDSLRKAAAVNTVNAMMRSAFGEQQERSVVPALQDQSSSVKVTLAPCGDGVDPDVHMYDKLHPNWGGEQVIARNLFPAVLEALVQTSRMENGTAVGGIRANVPEAQPLQQRTATISLQPDGSKQGGETSQTTLVVGAALVLALLVARSASGKLRPRR